MPISEMMLAEFEQEMANTRRTLERIEDEFLQWRPHDRSMSVAELAGHLADVPGWVPKIMESTEIDIAPPTGAGYEQFIPKTYLELLKRFDANMEKARTAIQQAGDETWMAQWTLKKGGQAMFSLPRVAVMRTMVMNHQIHHRGQMTVYFRLLDVPVPSLYGPSADEGNT